MPYTVIDLDGGIPVAVNDLGSRTRFPIVVHHGLIASIRDRALFTSLVDAGHDCFGIALDLQIRYRSWGFGLGDVGARVLMQHAVDDTSVPFATAQITASLLKRCSYDARTSGDHFSGELLDAFLRQTVLERAG